MADEDEFRLRKDEERGAQAQALLDSGLMTEAFDTLERDYTAAWKQTGAKATEDRERLWQAVQIVGKVKNHLLVAARDGQLARHELNQLTEQRSFLSRLKP